MRTASPTAADGAVAPGVSGATAPAVPAPSPQPSAAAPAKDSAGIRGMIFLRDRGIFVLWIALILAFAIWANPYFATLNNAVLIANAASISAIFAAGVAVGIICGALDLSIPGVAALSSCVAGWMLVNGLPIWLALATGIVLAAGVGLVNGLISLRGFNPIIVTIAMLSITSAIASIVAGGYTFPGLSMLDFMGTHRYLGVPAPVWICAGVFLVGTVFLTKTRDGIRLMAVGGSAEAVRRSGIHSDRYIVFAFIISSTCAGLGGLVTTAVVTEANPSASPALIFTALTAVALAGVSLAGGRGSLPRVLVGALVLATISNGLTIKGIQPYWATGVTGVLLIGSLTLERWVSKSVSKRLMATAQASVHTGTR
ncbi:ABC transporter permease [Demequina salsinemoris]|uniref:ABC transporter permease n=1 Tax=Demequina salsinemoris TaxID=577470 RepID=UPI0007862591|nr:ABC transporter permease [Demequina salsinemoris]